jgi:tRNA nucleotidyltransferase/poly(A) polymerase
MLRAVRFATVLDFTIEPSTLEAIRLHAGDLMAVSVERVVVELHKMWASPRAGASFLLLETTGLVAPVFPFLDASRTDVMTEARIRIERMSETELEPERRPLLGWAALLDLGRPGTDSEEELVRDKLPRDTIKVVLELFRTKRGWLDPSTLGEADRVRFATRKDLALGRAFAEVLRGPEVRAPWDAIERTLRDRPLPPLPLVTGEDLHRLGYTQGPRFKEILEAVDTEALERRISTRDEALDFVKRRFPF